MSTDYLQAATWVPGWAQRAVFYHIYPLGFLDAPLENPRSGEPTPRLTELSHWLDHLVDLGVTAIYLGPVFESETHGYDTVDYFNIDRRLGDMGHFRTFVDHVHLRNMRIILDGVFNHTGRAFFAFEDIRQRKRLSPYANWYHINWEEDSPYNDGFNYRGWHGDHTLPQLNLGNKEVKKYIFEVVKMWLADVGIDGWRLDAAQEVDPLFWWEFRRVCKEIKPESFIVGEVLDGDYRRYVAEDLLDSGTNYQLYAPMSQALNEGNYWQLKSIMDRSDAPDLGVYRDLLLFNFIGNHDLTRVLDTLADPRYIYPALLFLLTTKGIPCIYYGDEIGMRGTKEAGDHALRAAMPPRENWPDQRGHIFAAARRLIALRKAHPTLSYGNYTSLDVADRTFSFMRTYRATFAVIAINSSFEATPMTINAGSLGGIPDGTTFCDVLDENETIFTVEGGKLHFDTVLPCWGRILISTQD